MTSAKELLCQLKTHAEASLWSLAATVFIFAIVPAFLDPSVRLRWALAAGAFVLSVGILGWARPPIRRICALLLEAAQRAEADRGRILELEESCGRTELEKKNAEAELETKAREHVGHVAEEQARTAAAIQQAESLRLELERLRTEHHRLNQELSESSARRRLTETRNQDFDRRLREAEDAYAASVSKLKESEQAVLGLRETARALRSEGESFRQGSVRLQSELELVAKDRSNMELRLSQTKQELELLKSRADGAEARVSYLESGLPAQQATAARQEIEKLLQAEQAAKRELEVEKSGLESKIVELEQQARKDAQVLKELHEVCREKLAEPKPQVAEHFTWKVNYFHDNEVIFNFVNRGLPVDLIDATCDPALTVDLPSVRHVGRNEPATIRFSSRTILPQEFMVRVRMTVFAQEASFIVRAFDETKIERV